MNKKSRLLKVKHFFFSFFICGEFFDQLDGEWEECLEPWCF